MPKSNGRMTSEWLQTTLTERGQKCDDVAFALAQMLRNIREPVVVDGIVINTNNIVTALEDCASLVASQRETIQRLKGNVAVASGKAVPRTQKYGKSTLRWHYG